MSKINKKGSHVKWATSPVATVAKDLTTYEGAAAWSRDVKSDLFLLATTNF